MIQLPFVDRAAAARALAAALAPYKGSHPLVLGIPRGSVSMGRIIADALDGELDIVLVRKLGAPGNPEVAIGAVDEHGSIVLNEDAVWSEADKAYVEREAREQLALILTRRTRYGAGSPTDPKGRTVIVLDDGLATGATMESALRAVRQRGPSRLICAVPVAAPHGLARVRRIADEVICLATPTPFRAVGLYYRNFAPVTDEEVMQALHRREPANATAHRAVRIDVGTAELEGELNLPPSPLGLVIFAHGSASSRHSPRNRYVAEALNERGIATLLFDLLTPQEEMAGLAAGFFALELEAKPEWRPRAGTHEPTSSSASAWPMRTSGS